MSKATGHSWDPLRNLRPKLGSVGFHCIDSGRRTAAVCEAKLVQSRPRNRQEPARSLSTRRARCAIFRALGSAIAAVLLAAGCSAGAEPVKSAEPVATSVPPAITEPVATSVPPAITEPVATSVPPAITEPVATSVPAATRGDPRQQEFNEADEREYLRSLDRGAWAGLRFRMLALVGEDVIDDWTHEQFMEALTARQPGTRGMALQFRLDEQLIQELFKAARSSMQLRGTGGSFVPSQLGKVTGADAQAVSSLIESLEERAEGPLRNGSQINLIDSAWLRSVLNQQFQLRVGRNASSREQQSFVNEIHAAQRAGLAGASLDPVARAGEFAEQADPHGAAAKKRLDAGRTIREALQGTGP